MYADDLAEEDPAENNDTGGVVVVAVVLLYREDGYGSGKAEGSGRGEGMPGSVLPEGDFRITCDARS